MKAIEWIVQEELIRLAKNWDLGEAIQKVDWSPGMRLRIILELDILEDGARVHGFEFRFRKPDGRIVK